MKKQQIRIILQNKEIIIYYYETIKQKLCA